MRKSYVVWSIEKARPVADGFRRLRDAIAEADRRGDAYTVIAV